MKWFYIIADDETLRNAVVLMNDLIHDTDLLPIIIIHPSPILFLGFGGNPQVQPTSQ